MGLHLRFDRGTLLLDGYTGQPELPAVIWDPRVEAWRAPAHCWARLRAAAEGQVEEDSVFDAAQPGPEAWDAPSLRPYQAGAVASWQAAGRRGVVVLPTGAGKTRTALAAIAGCGTSTLILVPTRVLLHQWREVLSRHYPGSVGQYGDGQRELAPITVATYASARVHGERLGNRFRLLVVDEAHHFGAGREDEALELFAAPHRLGLTATPPDDPGRLERLHALIGPEVYRVELSELTGSFLAPLEVVRLRLQLTPSERRAYERDRATYLELARPFFRSAPGSSWSDFVGAAMRSAAGRRALAAWRRTRKLVGSTEAKHACVGELLRRHRRERVLVFTADNDAAYRLARDLLVMPLTCHIGPRERDLALTAFAEGRLRCLVSSRVLNEGLDVPAAEVAVLMGGSQGQREFLQRVGRVLRPAEGKRAIVYELSCADTYETRQSAQREHVLAS